MSREPVAASASLVLGSLVRVVAEGPGGHVRPAENETNQEGAPKDSQRVHAAVRTPSAMTSQRAAQGCGHPVKNVTAGKEMAAPGHCGPPFFSLFLSLSSRR